MHPVWAIVVLCHRVQHRPQLQLGHRPRHGLRQQLSLVNILILSGNSGPSDQNGSLISTRPQNAAYTSGFIVDFGGTLGTWCINIEHEYRHGPRQQPRPRYHHDILISLVPVAAQLVIPVPGDSLTHWNQHGTWQQQEPWI